MYNKNVEEVFLITDSSRQGLNSSQAQERLTKYGANKLKEVKKQSKFSRFMAQFKDILILILIASCIVSVCIALVTRDYSEFIDAGFILFVVIVNAIIGYIQENKAEEAMDSLMNMTKPFAKVLRNGKTVKIKTEDLTIGDIVILEAGDIVPADLRLFDVASLKIEESALTGESVPVDKNPLPITAENVPLGDRLNMAYMGSVVSYGRGRGVVVDIANNTEMGKIAGAINNHIDERTLLEKRIDKTSKIISVIVLIISLFIFIAGVVQGHPWEKSFMIAISIAVCAIPEGLPTGVTITMAMGVQRMSKKKAIVKKLSAVETLGSTEVICTDKTGTLTLNKMTVTEAVVSNMNADMDIKDNPNFPTLINCMLLCNDTTMKIDDSGVLTTLGDPTETALVHYGYTLGFSKDTLTGMYPRVNEIPFDSDRKLMTTLNTVEDKTVAHTKGAIDCILNCCTMILDQGKPREITENDKSEILAKNKEFCDRALRLLGYAVKEVTGDIYNIDKEIVESGMTFVGLTGMIDPPREEVKEAIKTCREAGITSVMITGDHKDTAFAIAKELGIASRETQVMTGAELDMLTDEEFSKKVKNYTVFARVSPENKVKIVKAYQSLDKVVAMTGDGVNDAPSIKKANIGIGMGITGTDVTKGVADIILTDDNFATIVSAVKEGRRIYSNILKIIQFLLGTAIAEVILLTTIIAFMGKDFFAPALILWINFVSDTFPAIALGVEREEPDIMKKQPNRQRKNLFVGRVGMNILILGFIQSLIVFGVYFLGQGLGYTHSAVVTMCFLSLVMVELFHSYNLRSETNSIFTIGVFSNKLINIAFVVSLALTVILILIPAGVVQSALGICNLTGIQWLISIGIAFAIVPITELYKVILRAIDRKKKKKELM